MAGSVGRLAISVPIRLRHAMKQVMTQKTTWKEAGFRYEADLGNGIVADLFPGGIEHDAKVFVSYGKTSISKEISNFWLKNWEIAKPDKK